MAERMVSLKGSVPVNKHHRIGPVDPKSYIEVTVRLRRKTEEGLPTLKEFIKGERAHGITRRILAQRYGSDARDAEAVRSWARSKRLSVTRTDLGMRQVHLIGSADAMAKAFGVDLAMYQHRRTRTRFRCPTCDISIPASLKGVIVSVFGLNDMPVVVRDSAIAKVSHPAHLAAADPKTVFPASFYPNEVADLYNFPDTKGANQRVAVLEFGGGFDPAVLSSYFKKNIKLPAEPTVNPIFILNTQMQLDDANTTGEVYLDVEIIGAMAPQATIDVYFAPWSGAGYLNAITQAIHNDDYAAISISYALDEDLRGTPDDPGWPGLNHAVDEAFRDAAAIGVPVFISTGDRGSGSDQAKLGQRPITIQTPVAHAGFPASSPYATAVGGTLLYPKEKQYDKEVVWNELGPSRRGQFQDPTGATKSGTYFLGWATGGGVSDRYRVPSYQSSAGIKPKSANTGNKPGRGIPDVAGNAGISTGYLVNHPTDSGMTIMPLGGTSAAAPMWAALMARIREALEQSFNGKVPSYFFNDFVYAVGKSGAFREVVGGRTFTIDAKGALKPGNFIPTGNNRSSTVQGYNASVGYDQCTGWGSPNGKVLLAQLETWLKSRK